MKRRAPLKRRTPLRRKTRLRSSNPKRKRTEWQRAYHSKARVEFVKRLPCALSDVIGLPARVNAHTKSGGVGRKADYTTIIPLTPHLHELQHRQGWRATFAAAGWLPPKNIDHTLRYMADHTETLWRRYQHGLTT